MARFPKKSLIFTMLFINCLTCSVNADQNDPRLDSLFAKLKTPLSQVDAQIIESKIWIYWRLFPNNQSVETSMKTAIEIMQAGNLQKAELLLSQIINQEPQFAEAWNKRATIRYLRGNYKGSAKDIANVLLLEPRHFGALSGLGMINMQTGNWSDALQNYQAAFSINPNLPNIERLIKNLKFRLRGYSL